MLSVADEYVVMQALGVESVLSQSLVEEHYDRIEISGATGTDYSRPLVVDSPTEVRPGDTLRLSLTLRNPYPYDYRFDGDSVKVGIVWRNLSETTRRYDLPEVQGLLPAGGTLRREARFVVPELPERTWQVGFTVSNLPVTTWFNGPTERIRTIAK